MIKVIQYGEGNFLRTFAEAYFDTLNKDGAGEYSVDVVQPIPFGTLEKFRKQGNKYHIVLRGTSGGKEREDVYKIDVLHSVISPFEEYEKYISLAKDKDLKIIVSNTTEAGICFNAADKFEDFAAITYPAKLTKFLYERYSAGLNGVYLLPVELIDNNADALKDCVSKYIKLWKLPDEFAKWNDTENYYCNTLVDRIVSGYPKDEATREHLYELIGEKDELVSIGEPFGLWAVENKGEISEYIKAGRHNVEVVLTNDIKYYKKRKVRVLNGSHTNIVPAGLWLGKNTVYDCMRDARLNQFLSETLANEIIPYVSPDTAATAEFAESVKERFLNPYLNHQLTSIALNSISKWKARDLPSFKDYYKAHGEIPENLTKGFAYLMAMYKLTEKREDGKYYAKLPSRTIEMHDEEKYLEYFANGGCVIEFMRNESVWGEDLTLYADFAEKVKGYVKRLRNGESDIL